MKKFVLLSLFFLLCFNFISSAQDVIFKKDGSKEEVKIILVGEKEIQYKKFNNLEGPVYTLSKKDIALITYQSGEFEMIKSPGDDKRAAKAELAENFAQNLITYHLFDVVYGDFTFSYERILSSGTIGIKIPIGFGYAYNSDYFNSNSNWVKNYIYSGIGVNFYLTGQGKWRYFIGPDVRIGYGKHSYSTWDQYGYYYEEEVKEGIYTKFYIDNGVIFTPIRKFSIAAVVGVGVRFFPEAGPNSSTVMPTGYFSTNVSYRF